MVLELSADGEEPSWEPFQYRGFYDFPLLVLIPLEERTILLDCDFDEEMDDYNKSYDVLELPPVSQLDLNASWNELPQRKLACLGTVAVKDVEFDETRRRFVNLRSVLQSLIPPR